MKKTLFIIAACTLAAVSCQKETAVENVACSEAILTVTADIARFDGDTKTSIDGAATTIKPVWSANDEIKLFNTKNQAFVYTIKAADVGKSLAEFEPKGTVFYGTFACACYPAETTNYVPDIGIITEIPDTQEYVTPTTDGANAGTFANGSFPMVGTGTPDSSKGNLNLTFKNVFGLVQLNFTGSETISRIDLVSTESLSGTATIATGSSCATTITNGKKYVTLTFKTPVTLTDTPTAFYLAVPADSTISTVYVTTGTGLQCKAKNITAARSHIASLNSTTLSGAGFVPVIYPEAPTQTPQIISGIVWAPVNCGYDADHLCGKLYQWGRMDGSGYYTSESTTPPTDAVDKVMQEGLYTSSPYKISEPADTIFYQCSELQSSSTHDWYTSSMSEQFDVWPMTTPEGTSRIGNPCPEGWRVPTSDEFGNMVYSDWNSSSQKGKTIRRAYVFDSGYATINGLTFPAAGYRSGANGNFMLRGETAYCWTSSTSDYQAICLCCIENSLTFNRRYRQQAYSVRCIQE